MDWLWGGVITVVFLILAGYGINTLLTSRRVTLFPLLREQEKAPLPPPPTQLSQVRSEHNEMREALALLEKGAGEMIPVETIMKKAPLTIHNTESVNAAAKMMAQHRVGSLLVMDGWGEVQGIVTETDIVRRMVASELSAAKTTVEQIMTAPVITIERRQSVRDADELMDRHQVRHLAVTDEGRIIGVISVRDLLRPIHLEHGA